MSESKIFNNVEYQREYYKNNKEKLLSKLNEKTKCDLCGGSYSYTGRKRHLLTKRHIKTFNNDNILEKKMIDDELFKKVRDFMTKELLR